MCTTVDPAKVSGVWPSRTRNEVIAVFARLNQARSLYFDWDDARREDGDVVTCLQNVILIHVISTLGFSVRLACCSAGVRSHWPFLLAPVGTFSDLAAIVTRVLI